MNEWMNDIKIIIGLICVYWAATCAPNELESGRNWRYRSAVVYI